MGRLIVLFLSIGVMACGSSSTAEREVAEHLQSVAREQGFEFSRSSLNCLSATYVDVLGAETALPHLRHELDFSQMVEELGAERLMARQQELNQRLLECEAVATPLNAE